MTRSFLQLTPLALATALALTASLTPAHAQGANNTLAEKPVQLSIARQPLAQALSQWAMQTGIQLIMHPELVAGMTADAVAGVLTPRQALNVLLSGSGLTATLEQDAVVIRRSLQTLSTTTLPEIKVTAEAEPESATGPVVGYVAKRSATGSRSEAALLETPRAISVITRDQVETQGASTVLQALNYSAGAATSNSPHSLDASQVWLRGFKGAENEVYYRDGMRNASGALFHRQSPEPYGLERIEVLKGPASVLFGQNEPGGIINLVAKRPTAHPQREVEVQLGSFDRRQLATDLSGPVDTEGTWSYRVVALKRNAGTQTDFAKDNRDYLTGALSWRPASGTTLTLTAEYQRNESLSFTYLPAEGTALPNPGGPIPVSRNLSDNNDEWFETRTIGYALAHRLDDQVALRQNVRYTDQSFDRRITGWPYFTDASSRVVETWLSRTTGGGHQLGIDTQAEARLGTGDLRHTIVLGLDYLKGSADFDQGGASGGLLDLFDPVYPARADVDLTTRYDQRLRQMGLYIQDQVRFDERWILSLAARKDWVKVDNRVTDTLADESERTLQPDQSVTGQAGVLYRFDSGWAPYLSYASSFSPAVGTAADGAAFSPQEGKQFELGVKYEPPAGNSLYTLAVFDLRKTNVLTADMANPGHSVQTGEIRSRGAELEAKVQLHGRLNVIGSLAYVDPKVTRSNDGLEGRQVPSAARVSASLWLDYQATKGPLAGTTWAAGVRHIGAKYGDDANTFRVPAYTLVDLALRYDLRQLSAAWQGARLSFNVNNVADRTHVGYCYYQCQYGARRTASAALQYRW